MRIISLNANGIRAAARKGVFDWLDRQNADLVCIQETKAQRHQLEDPVFSPPGYHVYYHDAQKKVIAAWPSTVATNRTGCSTALDGM